MTLRVGVIGHPVAHSISPRFQQAGFDAADLNVRYEAWDLEPGELEGFIDQLRDDDALGANITIPYKEAALRHMDGLHQTARFVGAINTIVNNAGHLQGYNTDVTAFSARCRRRIRSIWRASAAVGRGRRRSRGRLGVDLARSGGADDHQSHGGARRTVAARPCFCLGRGIVAIIRSR